jgi:hypothetical protein
MLDFRPSSQISQWYFEPAPVERKKIIDRQVFSDLMYGYRMPTHEVTPDFLLSEAWTRPELVHRILSRSRYSWYAVGRVK